MAQDIGNYSYSDPEPLANWVRNLLYLDIFVTGLLLIAVAIQYLSLQEFDGVGTNGAQILVAATSDAGQFAVSCLSMAVNLASSIVVLCWIYRAMANSWALTDFEMEYTPGWAVGWYFVPFANLVKPYAAMKEIWRENVEQASERPRQNNLTVWWTLWVASRLLGIASTRMVASDDIGTILTGMQLSILDSAVAIALDLVFLSIVRTVTRGQVERYERQENEEGSEATVEIAWE